MSEPTAYELYRSGIDLLEQRDHHAAALPLRRARDLEPTTAMVREALGRALFGSQRYREAAEEFGVLVELEPVNHYAQFCLGRALQLQGLHTEARPPLTMAALLQPERADYRVYRDRTIAAIESGGGAGSGSKRGGAGAGPAGGGAGAGSTRGGGSGPTQPGAGLDSAGPAGSSGDGSTRAGAGGSADGDVPPAGSRRSGEGPWGAPAAEVSSSDGTDVARGDRGTADGSGSSASDDAPEDLGGPPPRS